MDSIEEAKIDTDEDGFHLILTGDFARTFQEYLNDTEYTLSVDLRIPADVMFDLATDIRHYEDWRR